MMRTLDGTNVDCSYAGIRLRMHRLRRNVVGEELAADLGVSRSSLFLYERGFITKIETLVRIADVLGVSVGEVIAPLSVDECDEAVQSLIDAAGIVLLKRKLSA